MAPPFTPITGDPKTGFTPIPNTVLDSLPALSDSELRLLLVVARATLGWSEGSGRKRSAWLSHRKLQAITGRAGEAVSRAAASLVEQGLLVAETEGGMPLPTPEARRAHRGRILYRLGNSTTQLGKVGDSSRLTEVEVEAFLSPATSAVEFGRPGTIKQRGKENKAALISIDTSSLGTEVVSVDLDGLERPVPPESASLLGAEAGVQETDTPPVSTGDGAAEFVARFEAAYRKARPGEAAPPIGPEDLEQLERLLERLPAGELARWLPAFFACEFGYVRRRNWSLGSFLETVHVLRAARGTSSHWSS